MSGIWIIGGLFFFWYYQMMQAIILVAGRGTRMAPLTDTLPKPMLKVLDKNLIEWKLEALPNGITGITLVVGYMKEIIESYFGDSWKNIPITYIEQKELNGTGGAILDAKDTIQDKALILMGDDIYTKEDLQILSRYDFALMVHDQGEAALLKKGQVITKDGLLHGLNEGDMQSGTPSTLINTGACVISKTFFNYPLVRVSDKEYGLPHTLVSISKEIPIHIVHATTWIQITTPECLLQAENILK